MADGKEIITVVNWIAGILAVLVTTIPPLGYFTVTRESLMSHAETEAKNYAIAITQFISDNPKFWRFEETRISFLIERMTFDKAPMSIRVFDSRGRPLAQRVEPLDSPAHTQTAPFYLFGEAVGNVEVDHSLRPVLLKTGAVGAIGLLFGFMVFFPLRIIPLRALRRATDNLARERDYIGNIITSMMDSLIVVSPEGTIQTVNPTTLNILGYAEDELINQPIGLIIAEEEVSIFRGAGLDELVRKGFVADVEKTYLAKDGQKIPVLFSGSVMRDADNKMLGIACMAMDITERKQAEDKIKASLAEKEVLLREIHHRVKNNLQVISSMLWLQANVENNTHTVEVLRGSYRRVMLMAQIHDSLHRHGDLSVINAGDLLNTLITDTKTSSGDVSEHLSFHIDVEDIPLDVDHANAYGQIISELLSNSLKHAFADGQPGKIEVSLRRVDGGVTELSVADDGKGLPEDFDLQQIKTLGLQLVRSLAAKLGGAIHIDGSGGTRVQIDFPEERP